MTAGQEIKETWIWPLSQEDPLEEEMATHASIFALTVPWTEEPGGLQSMGFQRVGHNWTAEHGTGANKAAMWAAPEVWRGATRLPQKGVHHSQEFWSFLFHSHHLTLHVAFNAHIAKLSDFYIFWLPEFMSKGMHEFIYFLVSFFELYVLTLKETLGTWRFQPMTLSFLIMKSHTCYTVCNIPDMLRIVKEISWKQDE